MNYNLEVKRFRLNSKQRSAHLFKCMLELISDTQLDLINKVEISMASNGTPSKTREQTCAALIVTISKQGVMFNPIMAVYLGYLDSLSDKDIIVDMVTFRDSITTALCPDDYFEDKWRFVDVRLLCSYDELEKRGFWF